MATERAERFMAALQGAERGGGLDGLVALFAGDAELSNLSGPEPHRGVDGAREFWREYLGAFGKIGSRFTHVLEGPDSVVLEWVSDGTLKSGEPISYRGVSVLEMTDGLVRRFRTYYDTAALRSLAVARG